MNSKLFIAIGLCIELASISITILSGYLVGEAESAQVQAHFEQQVERGMSAAQARLKNYELALQAGAGLFNASNSVDPGEWTEFVRTLDVDTNYPGIGGFGFISKVPVNQWDAYVAGRKTAFNQDFSVRVLDAVPAGDRYIIDLIEPLGRNKKALGLDIGSNPLRRRAADEAMRTGTAQISNAIVLVQDAGKKPGFLMLVPVYATRQIPKTEAERIQQCIGWSYAPFVGEKVMAGVNDIAGQGVHFSIYDGRVAAEAAIYDGIGVTIGSQNTERSVTIGNQEWLFQWTSLGDLGGSNSEALWVILSGFFTSTGLLVVMLMLHASNNKANERQRMAQLALERSNGELSIARQQAEDLAAQALAASLAKSQFLAQMSHELRTPLNAIIGFSNRLRQKLDGREKQGNELIYKNGHHLLNLINNLLDMAKIEAGKMETDFSRFSLDESLSEICATLQSIAREKDLILHYALSEGVDDIYADHLKFRQIITNLLGNALKFTRQGSVNIQVSEKDDTQYGPEIHVAVRDTGPGISPEKIPDLFQAFEQGDMTDVHSAGTGLGLVIAQKFAQLHGGRIEVESELGVGSTFTLILPIFKPGETVKMLTSRAPGSLT